MGVTAARPVSPKLPVVVCSNLVLGENGLLLVRETKPSALGRWSLPGGKLEPGETLKQGAEREAHEESGLTVEARQLLGIYHCLETLEGGAALNFVFQSRIIGGTIQTSVEHPAVDFVPLAELDALVAENLIRGSHVRLAVEAAINGTELSADIVSIVPASFPPTRVPPTRVPPTR